MIEKVGHVRNPLTVIAIFAAITEVGGRAVLPFLEAENQALYLWFLIAFPTLLVALFFVTLNFNHRVLYAPSDFEDESHFLLMSATSDELDAKLAQEAQRVEQSVETGDSVSEITLVDPMARGGTVAEIKQAEHLALRRLSDQTGIRFEEGVRVKTSGNRAVVFDGVGEAGKVVHAAEVKLVSNQEASPEQLYDRIVLEAELIAERSNRKMVLHLVTVVKDSQFDREVLIARLKRFASRRSVQIELHIFSLDTLKGEHN